MWAPEVHTFLPVDDPVVAVAHRAGGERREIRSCAGFAEQLAVDVLTGIQGPKELSLLFLGADRDDGRCGHAVADAVLVHLGGWRSGGGQRGVELFLKALPHTETAVALWKLEPRKARVEPCAEKLLRISALRVVCGEQLPNSGIQIVGNRFFVECHGWSPR